MTYRQLTACVSRAAKQTANAALQDGPHHRVITNKRHRVPIRFIAGSLLLALPAALIVACSGGGPDEAGPSAGADVPTPRTAARLGAGAGPTPVPVTPTPTATPSPKHLSVYEPVWEGTYTIREAITKEEITKKIVVEFMVPKLAGEGKNRRRDEGAIEVEGIDWLTINFTRIDPKTGSVAFRVPVNQIGSKESWRVTRSPVR